MEKSIDNYLNRLNLHVSTGYVFNIVKYPYKTYRSLCASMVILSILFELSHGTYLIVPAMVLLMCLKLRFIQSNRDRVLNRCIALESIFHDDFSKMKKEHGCDPNFPSDELYITEDDRNDIFWDCMKAYNYKSLVKQLKYDNIFTIKMTIMYILIFLISIYL